MTTALVVLGATGLLSGPLWMFMGIAFACVVLGIGQIERYIRREALRRRDERPR